jgi:predicted TIM-barrel fold metal-dependent hydrolase
MPRVDAHHHFWDPDRYSYPWMAGDAMLPVRRGFAPDDLRGTLGEERIDGTVLVQTLSSPQETHEFLALQTTSTEGLTIATIDSPTAHREVALHWTRRRAGSAVAKAFLDAQQQVPLPPGVQPILD